MSQNKKTETEHCCERMDFFLEEERVAIYYNPVYREYFIRLWSFPKAKHVIYACPWCGHKFSPSLIEKYFQILDSEYKIVYCDYSEKYFKDDTEYEHETEVDVPKEFKSDEWWKKRGL